MLLIDMEKRGLSVILTTVLIIVLTIGAIVIVWNYVIPTIRDTGEELELGQINVFLDVLRVEIVDGLTAKVTVKNSGKSPVDKVKIVLSDGKSSKSYDFEDRLDRLEIKNYDVALGVSQPTIVEAFPILKTASGKEVIGYGKGVITSEDIVYSYNSLIGYWNMETLTNDGKLKDLSGKGSDGTINGIILTTNGKVGGAFNFDGVNNFVDMGNPDVLNQDFRKISISFWVYPNAVTGADAGLVGKGTSPYGTTYHSINPPSIFGYIVDGGYSVSHNAPTNSWYHVVLTFDGATPKESLYINGNFVDGNSNHDLAAGIRIESNPFLIGKRVGPPDVYFNGIIDEVRVYNKALTDEEVNILYRQGQ